MAAEAQQDPIAEWIELDQLRPGPQGARLREYGVPVWVLIGYWQGSDYDANVVARDFDLPLEAVEMALAYYRLHPAPIDARIAVNAAAFTT